MQENVFRGCILPFFQGVLILMLYTLNRSGYENHLFVNDGGAQFTDQAAARGVADLDGYGNARALHSRVPFAAPLQPHHQNPPRIYRRIF